MPTIRTMRYAFYTAAAIAVLNFGVSHASDAPPSPAPAAQSAKPCSAGEFHTWDFWLGQWRVTSPDGKFQGTNEITLAPTGCGMIEHWHSAGGGDGMSFNGYDSVRKTWTQLWLSAGSVIRLEGKLDGKGALRTSGTISYHQQQVEHPFRGNWIPQADGSVVQEFFEQDPKTRKWSNWFTGIYRHVDAQPEKAGCETPEARQFDFWVGKWDVFDAQSGERAGSSLIEKLYGGCAIRENWSEPGFTGGSLNTFVATDRKWHQVWVDQSGARREFVGGMEDGAMVIVASVPSQKEPGKTALVRIKFTANPDRTVRQYSDISVDDGKTWKLRYDYIYRPAV